MFSNLLDIDYLPLKLRADFDNLRKEIEKMLDNPSLTSQKINTQIEKLNDAKK